MVNQSLSALLCLSPSLNDVDASFSADYPVSVPVHFEMSCDNADGRVLQFRAGFQHLGNFTYVGDPVFVPFSEVNHLRKFFTDESHLVLEVVRCKICVKLNVYLRSLFLLHMIDEIHPHFKN